MFLEIFEDTLFICLLNLSLSSSSTPKKRTEEERSTQVPFNVIKGRIEWLILENNKKFVFDTLTESRLAQHQSENFSRPSLHDWNRESTS